MNAIILFSCLIVLLSFVAFLAIRNRTFLEKKGVSAEALIVDWRSSASNQGPQSLAYPILEFTTKNGEQLKGGPIMGIVESNQPVNI